MDDESIISLLRDRDERAVSELKQKYEKLCFHIAAKILSQQEDIEECVNEAYLSLWDSSAENAPANLRLYLCRLVKNCAINKLKYNTAAKRNAELTSYLEELSDCLPVPESIEDTVSAELLGETISIFLRTQKTEHRKVFIRRYWYSESVSEIAEFYHMNEKTVATYLFRTRKRLKEYLKKEGYFS